MDDIYDKWWGKMKHEVVKVKREAKRLAEMETPLEMNMREATSDRNWGCANTVLHEIALSSQSYSDRQKIMIKVWEKLASVGDRWRRILKTLSLLEFLIKNGAEQVMGEVQSEQTKVKALLNFKQMEDGQDRGNAVREKAKFILEMVDDKKLYREERDKAKEHRNKFAATANAESHGGGSSSGGGGGSSGMASAASGAMSGAFGDSGRIAKDSFEAKFNELKQKKTEDCKPSWEKPGFKEEERRAKEQDRGRPPASRSDRQGDGRRDRSPQRSSSRSLSPGVGADRNREPKGAGGGEDYDLFDPSQAAPRSSSESEDDDRAQAPKAFPKPPGSKTAAPASDLLDMLDDPAPAASGGAGGFGGGGSDWAAFGSAAPAVMQETAPSSSAPPGDWAAFGSTPATASGGMEDMFGGGANAPFGGGDAMPTSGGFAPFGGGNAMPSSGSFAPFGGAPMAAAPFVTPAATAQPFQMPVANGGMPVANGGMPVANGGYPAPVVAPATAWQPSYAGGHPAPAPFSVPAAAPVVAPEVSLAGPAKLASTNVEDCIANLTEFTLTSSAAPAPDKPVPEEPVKQQGPIDFGDPFAIAAQM